MHGLARDEISLDLSLVFANRSTLILLFCYVGQTTLAEVTVRTQAVRKLSGVDSVEVTLNKELLVGKEFVHSLIRRKIREWERKPKMGQTSYPIPIACC